MIVQAIRGAYYRGRSEHATADESAMADGCVRDVLAGVATEVRRRVAL